MRSIFCPKLDRITASVGFSAYSKKVENRAGALATGTLVHRRTGAHVKKCVYYNMEEEYVTIKIKKKDLERLIALLEKLEALL
ncbi:MAG: hypothetical protein RXR51_04070 [Nitrososphaeria archaeon]